MDLIFITGIVLLLVLLCMITGGYIYLRLLSDRHPSLSLRSHSGCDLEICLLKIGELQSQLEIEQKKQKTYHALYIIFVVISSVVGVLLTTGFIRQTTDPVLLGWIGVITLTCTLLDLYIRPEKKRDLAQRRSVRLTSVIRECKDLMAIHSSSDNSSGKALCSKIVKTANACLSRLESEKLI